MNKEVIRVLEKAEGYIELGLTDDAWATLDMLPAEKQIHFPVLAIRVKILLASKSWYKAEILAESLTQAMPVNGRAWYCLAQALAQQDKISEAKEALKRAFAVEKSLKEEALNDPHLSKIW